MKEVIYTGIFLLLAVILGIVLSLCSVLYRGSTLPVLLSTGINREFILPPLKLNSNTFDLEVSVDARKNSDNIRLGKPK